MGLPTYNLEDNDPNHPNVMVCVAQRPAELPPPDTTTEAPVPDNDELRNEVERFDQEIEGLEKIAGAGAEAGAEAEAEAEGGERHDELKKRSQVP